MQAFECHGLWFLPDTEAPPVAGTLRVSSLYGPVEWKAVASASFSPLAPSTQTVQIGDELRTGSGGTVMTVENVPSLILSAQG